MTLSEELKKVIQGDVDDSPQVLNTYATDASLFYVKPQVVVFPKSVDDVKKLVHFATEAKKSGRNVSLTARSAGTDMTGGALSESIVVSFTKYMNKLLELGQDYAIVEPGMYYRDFEKETLKKDLILPSYPASRELCAMGGIVNNNSGGEKTLRYGKTERYVESINMVMADGNEYEFSKVSEAQLKEKMALMNFEGQIYRNIFDLISKNLNEIKDAKPDVTKNSAGYYLWNVYDEKEKTFDLVKLFVGAQGTLGLMTKAKIKLIHPDKHSKMLLIFLKDINLLTKISQTILPLQPESFEAYDDNTFKMAMKFFFEIIHQMKRNLLKVALSTLPEFWILLAGGIPKLVLLAEFTGNNEEEVSKKAESAKQALEKVLPISVKMRVTQSKDEEEEFWAIRRDSFNLLRKHVRGLRTAPFIDDFSVKADKLPEFLPKLYKIMSKYKMIYTIAGHIGDGNFHIIPLMNLADPKSKLIIEKLSKEVYNLILSFDGTITSEHNDGIIRTPFLRQMYGDRVCELFAETKKIFDPLDIFNPGKKVPIPGKSTGGTFEYATEHINTKM